MVEIINRCGMFTQRLEVNKLHLFGKGVLEFLKIISSLLSGF